MGAVRCPDHGLQVIGVCCAHVAAAIDDGARRAAHVVLDDWMTPSVVCAACERVVRAAPRSTGEPDVGFGHVIEQDARCSACIDAWYEAAGHGPLREVVDRLRAPHLP